MQEHNFTIKYRKGQLNANADALSRYVHPEISTATTQISSEFLKSKLQVAQQ